MLQIWDTIRVTVYFYEAKSHLFRSLLLVCRRAPKLTIIQLILLD